MTTQVRNKDMASIDDRVRKLLALANDPGATRAEAALAREKANDILMNAMRGNLKKIIRATA